MAIENGRWMELSSALVAIVKQAAGAVVRVDPGRRGSSGVVWSADGTIVTASHAVDDDEATIGLPSGDTVDAEVVGRDASTDLAVLRTRASAGLAAVTWSDGPIEVGQLVFSVTRPGRGPRAAVGVVSRAGDGWRTSAGGKVDRYVELDLGLHPGFSGGLLLDASGHGFGLASAGLVRGVALAVPFPTLTRVVTSLVAHGRIRRGYLGVSTLPVRFPPNAPGGSARESALLVTAVEEGSPAAIAGLMIGDVLLALDGAPIERMSDLLAHLDEERVGAALLARVLRGGAPREVTVTVGTRGGGRERSACP